MSIRPLTIAHTESSVAWGGQEIRILTEMKGLRERGHRMLLAAPERSQIFARATDEDFEVLALHGSNWSLPMNAWRLANWLGGNEVDVLNPHSSRDGWAAGFGGRLAGVPIIIRSRHFDVPFGDRIFSRLVYTGLADHLITTSPVVSENFCRTYGLTDDRVSTIPTGVDTRRFLASGTKADLPVPRGQLRWPLVGMVAVMRRAKGHIDLVQAARMLHDRGRPIRLIFVGDGPFRSPIEDEVKRQGLEDAVSFTGHRDDVPELLRTMDCVAFPSYHECIPQGAMQAMACGIPVIGSDAGGIPSVVRHGETGRSFPAGDVSALADSLESVLKEKATTERLRKNAEKFAAEDCSLSVMLDRLEELYSRLLADCHAGPSYDTVTAQ